MTIASDVGAELYQRAKASRERPPAGGALDVAIGIFGRGITRQAPLVHVDATLCTINTRRHIVLRRGLSARRQHFLVGQMLARLVLESESWFTALSPTERVSVEQEIGAWLVAPPDAFRARVHQVGVELDELASAFAITETCAAMRVGELGIADSAVTTPTRVHVRGARFAPFEPADLRRVAARRAPSSVRKVPIGDEPGRVALLAKAS